VGGIAGRGGGGAGGVGKKEGEQTHWLLRAECFRGKSGGLGYRLTKVTEEEGKDHCKKGWRWRTGKGVASDSVRVWTGLKKKKEKKKKKKKKKKHSTRTREGEN